MKKTALATALILAASATQAEWIASGIVAIANPGAPVSVGIAFDTTEQCDVAHLVIYGNADIAAMGLMVDGQSYGAVGSVEVAPGMMIAVAGPAALRAIKTGETAAVVTDQGTLAVSLAGSSAALNAAYAACMAEVAQSSAQIFRPLMPSGSNAPAGSVNF